MGLGTLGSHFMERLAQPAADRMIRRVVIITDLDDFVLRWFLYGASGLNGQSFQEPTVLLLGQLA